jgi:hypothetical protein
MGAYVATNSFKILDISGYRNQAGRGRHRYSIFLPEEALFPDANILKCH